MISVEGDQVHMIPIEKIRVLNPRVRNQRVFSDIVDNISRLGLKKPITVRRRNRRNSSDHYDLVCGQGRLEAYSVLQQNEIPAIVVSASKEDSLIMGLVENLARRKHSTMELLQDLRTLRKRHYSIPEIAAKVDLSPTHVRGMLKLFNKGEERLLVAVENGQMPLRVALNIAAADSEDVQRVLMDAYEKNDLRGSKLMKARHIVLRRQKSGKNIDRSRKSKGEKTISTRALVRAYRREMARQKLLIKKSDVTERRLLFISSALKELFADENFVTLLRAEHLDTLPRNLADRVKVPAGV